MGKLYKFDHPMIVKRLPEIFAEVSKILSDEQSLSFSETEGVFLVNGEQVEADTGFVKRFVENLRDLELGSLELKRGLSIDEFAILMQLLTKLKNIQSVDQVKQYLEEKGVQHIIPLSAMYKLVKEDEEVIKEDKILKIDEVAPEIIGKFTQDLQNNNVGERLKKEEKFYKFLAHDPDYLFETTCNLLKKNPTPEEFERILWLIGDYLIDEIDSAKAEKLNSKILEELKNRLLSLCEKEKDKECCRQQTQAAFDKISATMQLRGLILLYKKHKKDIEGVANKLEKILETLPTHSRLYQKTKEKLQKIGAPIFKFTVE